MSETLQSGCHNRNFFCNVTFVNTTAVLVEFFLLNLTYYKNLDYKQLEQQHFLSYSKNTTSIKYQSNYKTELRKHFINSSTFKPIISSFKHLFKSNSLVPINLNVIFVLKIQVTLINILIS